VRHEHTDDTGVMELYYEFSIGSGTPSSCQVTGYVTGNNDDLDVYGYDWATTSWVQIGNIQGSNSTINSVNSFDMFVNMVGTGANAGTVRIRFYKTSGLTTALLAIDQIFVAFSQEAVSALNAVYFDSGASNTGTTSIDGVPGNPVSTEAAVNTLLAARNLEKVEVALESSITFATSHVDEFWHGEHWALVLGGQDVSGSHFTGADVSGTGTGSTRVDFKDSTFHTCTLPPLKAVHCEHADGTITFGGAGDYIFSDDESIKAGSGTPVIDTGAAIGNVNLTMPNYHQGIEIRNLNNAGADAFSISGIGQIIYASSCSGAVNQRGDWKVTNTGGVTITADDNTANVVLILEDTANMQPKLGTPAADVSADIAAIPTTAMRGTDGANTTVPDAAGTAPTAAEVVNEWETQSQADPTGFHVNIKEWANTAVTLSSTSTKPEVDVNSISDSTDAADKAEASFEALETAAAAAGTLSTTEMTTDLTEVTDDHYNGRIIVWTSGVLLRQATNITDYDGATKKLTFTAVTEAPTAADTFVIV